MTRIALAAIDYARRNKRSVKVKTSRLSDDLFAIENGSIGRALLATVARLSRYRIPLLGGLSRRLLRSTMMWAISVHITAGEHSRSVRMARVMNAAFRSSIRARDWPAILVYVDTFYRPGLHKSIVREFPRAERLGYGPLMERVARAQLYCGETSDAIETLSRFDSARMVPWQRALLWRCRGLAHTLAGNADAAETDFQRAIDANPQSVMSHHNFAGRYDPQTYAAPVWELRTAGKLVAYDALNFAAESMFLAGDALGSMRVYQMALKHQQQLAASSPVPRSVALKLSLAFDSFDPDKPIRLLPYEWCTQFGHIGLLDGYLKMCALGVYPDSNVVLLAPPDKVANDHYLWHFERLLNVVRAPDLVNELFPYQRQIGDSFMALPCRGEHAEPWTRAAARTQVAWAQDRRGPLLTLDPMMMKTGRSTLGELGIDPDRWYVGLHVRAGSFYGESKSGISDHRNSSLEDYLPAVRDIVERGGIVVRLGDSSMEPIPKIEGFVDYARSEWKSPAMDLFLLATSRLVVGTTSGLTTAALSFGTPMVLANCISNDWQLWSEQADFILKKVWCWRRRRYLSLTETYRLPMQGKLINNVLLERSGLEIHANTSDEIRAAVRFKLAKVIDDVRPALRDGDLLDAYHQAMADNPYNFGAASPVPEFLRMNRFLLEPATTPDAAPKDWPALPRAARRAMPHGATLALN